jgi:hypothetical protein
MSDSITLNLTHEEAVTVYDQLTEAKRMMPEDSNYKQQLDAATEKIARQL